MQLTQVEGRHARELFEELFDELTVIGLHADGSTTSPPRHAVNSRA